MPDTPMTNQPHYVNTRNKFRRDARGPEPEQTWDEQWQDTSWSSGLNWESGAPPRTSSSSGAASWTAGAWAATQAWTARGASTTIMKDTTISTEWAAVVAMILTFTVGFLMGAMTSYIVMTVRAQRRVTHRGDAGTGRGYGRVDAGAAAPPRQPQVIRTDGWILDTGADHDRAAPAAVVNARTQVGPTPDTVTVTRTGLDFHRTGCYYLDAGNRARTNRTFARCTFCFPMPRRDDHQD